MITDQHRAKIAGKILADREERYALFPSEIFDEYAWNMLLHLFIAMDAANILSESELIRLVHTSTNTGQRWLYQLAKDGQVEPRRSGDNVTLTTTAKIKLRQYLDTVQVQ
ncbi:MAG: hypothetical protein EOO77_45470 [Oxalobacteraceae bacterium]|nr:MAG: hypothetical protein EOO77_45470 [Oxalobacteraceae bacterium]